MKGLDSRSIAKLIETLDTPVEAESIRIRPIVRNLSICKRSDGALGLFFDVPVHNARTEKTLFSGLEQVTSNIFTIVEDRNSRVQRTRPGCLLTLRDDIFGGIFCAVVAHAASEIRRNPERFDDLSKITSYISTWIKCFSVVDFPIEKIVGLWGELYIISVSPNIERAVAAWTGPFGEPFDFIGGGLSLEVKTTVRSGKSTFSLGQVLDRKLGWSVFITIVNDDRVGLSIDDLLGEIRSKLKNDTQFEAALARTGYRPGASATRRYTAQTTRVISNSEIPTPEVTDRRIVGVRFDIDIEGLSDSFRPLGPILKKLCKSLAGVRKS